jgi:hypothetical protein
MLLIIAHSWSLNTMYICFPFMSNMHLAAFLGSNSQMNYKIKLAFEALSISNVLNLKQYLLNFKILWEWAAVFLVYVTSLL